MSPGEKGFLYSAQELGTKWAGYATDYLFGMGQASWEAEKPPLFVYKMKVTPKKAKEFGLLSKYTISFSISATLLLNFRLTAKVLTLLKPLLLYWNEQCHQHTWNSSGNLSF